jgi:hypothetical protein
MAAALNAREKAVRRRSTPFSFRMNNLDTMDGIGCNSLHYESPFRATPRLRPIQFGLPQLEPLDSRPASRDQMDVDGGVQQSFGSADSPSLKPQLPINDREMPDCPQEASFQLR